MRDGQDLDAVLDSSASGAREFLTVGDAAALLRVSRNTMYELVWRGDIPSLRLGRLIRIQRSALLTWAEQASTSPNADKRVA